MFHDRCDHALRTAREDFERTLVVLREENSTLRRMLEAAATRADALLTELAKSVAVQPTPKPAPAPVADRRPTSKDPIEGLGNVLDPVDFGHHAATFNSPRAASLMLADDESPDGAAAAA